MALKSGTKPTAIFDLCCEHKIVDFIGFKMKFGSVYIDDDVIKSGVQMARWKLVTKQLDNIWAWGCASALPNIEQYECWELFFMSQGIDIAQFIKDLKSWALRSDPKLNTLFFSGPTNCGKTLVVNAICEPFITAFITNIQRNTSDFLLSPLLDSTIGVLEEVFLVPDIVNDYKRLLEGGNISVGMKFHSPQLLTRRPIICTSQWDNFGRGYLHSDDERAFVNRCYKFTFHNSINLPVKLTSAGFWFFVSRYGQRS